MTYRLYNHRREIAIQVLGILGNIATAAFLLSSGPTIMKMIKTRSSGGISGNLYVLKLFNCLLWVFYAFPHLVQPNSFWVLLTNSLGCLFALMYILPYLCYSTKNERLNVIWKLVVVACSLIFMVTSVLLALHTRQKRIAVVGILCGVVSSAMHLSLLSQTREAIKFRDAAYLHPYSSVAGFIKGFVWTAYGLVSADLYIVVPNAFGVTIGCLQLSLGMILMCMPKVFVSKNGCTTERNGTREGTIDKRESPLADVGHTPDEEANCDAKSPRWWLRSAGVIVPLGCITVDIGAAPGGGGGGGGGEHSSRTIRVAMPAVEAGQNSC